MATAHLSVKVGKAGKGTPHAEYISRMGKYAQRLEQGEKLEQTESGNMPKWAQNNPLEFWRAADQYERKNGTVYREHEIALPRELNAEQRTELVREWVQNELGDRHAYTWAIHNKTALDGGEQPHVHLMFSERMNDGIERDPEQYFKRYNSKFPERGGAKKHRSGETPTERKEALQAMRERWEQLHNAHLEKYGHGKGISMKSLAEQGIDREAEPHMTPSESAALHRKAIADRLAAEVLRESPIKTEPDFRQPEAQANKRDFLIVFRELSENLTALNKVAEQRLSAQERVEQYEAIRANSRQAALSVREQYTQREQKKSGLFGLMKNKDDEHDLQQLARRYANLKTEFERYDREYQNAKQQRDEINEQTQPHLDKLEKDFKVLKTEFDRIPAQDIETVLQGTRAVFESFGHEKRFDQLTEQTRNKAYNAGYKGEFGIKMAGCLLFERATNEFQRLQSEQEQQQNRSPKCNDWEMER